MANGIVNLSKDDYREFNFKVDVLTKKGYDLPFTVDYVKEDDTYNIQILGEHDLEELDRLTGSFTFNG